MTCCVNAYVCPKSGETECLCHGGFDNCCDHPECPGNLDRDHYRILVVDDLRTPLTSTTHDIIVTIYRTSDEALPRLQQIHDRGTKVGELWLDYDLGFSDAHPDGDTIEPVIEWLVERGKADDHFNVEYIFIHSHSPFAFGLATSLEPYYKAARAPLPEEESVER